MRRPVRRRPALDAGPGGARGRTAVQPAPAVRAPDPSLHSCSPVPRTPGRSTLVPAPGLVSISYGTTSDFSAEDSRFGPAVPIRSDRDACERGLRIRPREPFLRLYAPVREAAVGFTFHFEELGMLEQLGDPLAGPCLEYADPQELGTGWVESPVDRVAGTVAQVFALTAAPAPPAVSRAGP